MLCWQWILLWTISVCEPSRRLVAFSPFSELAFGNGETERLCLGGSELLGWLTFVYLKCTFRRTPVSFVDAPFPLWQRCPVVVCEMAGCFLMKSLSVSLPKVNGPKPWWQTGSAMPSPSKVIPWRGYCQLMAPMWNDYRSFSGRPVWVVVARTRQVTVSCLSPSLAGLFLRLRQKGNSVPWRPSVLLLSYLLEVSLTFPLIATLQFHTFWKAFFKNRIIFLKLLFL